MKRTMNRAAAIALLLLSVMTIYTATAQEGGRGIAMQGIYDRGTIRLRWATGSPVTWGLIRRNGIELRRQATTDSTASPVGGRPLRVWTEEEWRRNMNESRSAAQVVTLLRDDEKERQGLSEWAEADLEQNKLTSLLLMAEFDFGIARGLALAFEDSATKPGEIYRYEILLPDPVLRDTLRAEVFVRAEDEPSLPPASGLKAGTGDRYIDLWWTRTSVHSGYRVERRGRGESAWVRLNRSPLIFADNYPNQQLYRDSVANGKVYEYRIIGTDAFGRESEPSAIAEAQARDLTAPQPPYDVKWEKTPKGARITWQVPENEPDLAGFGLLRSNDPEEGYRPVHSELLGRRTTSYDDTISATGTYFYRLVSSDSAGNVGAMSVRAMAIIEDSLAPPAPGGLIATADTNGVITVRWNHRPEGDVAGYRIYRMVTGGAEPEFVPLNRGAMPDSIFTDTLMATVRDRFQYRVRTVDFAGNYSEPSAPVGVQFPDMLPPVKPIVDDYTTAARKVRIRYVSPSLDVASYEIRRASSGAGIAEIRFRSAASEWTDTTAEHGSEYRYTITAIDSAGNVSPASDPLFVKPFWTMEMKSPIAPRVEVESGTGRVKVSWSLPADAGWSAIVFRKSASDGTFLQLSPALTETSYTDTTAKPGVNEYALKFYFPEQGGTPLGRAAAVEIPEKQ